MDIDASSDLWRVNFTLELAALISIIGSRILSTDEAIIAMDRILELRKALFK